MLIHITEHILTGKKNNTSYVAKKSFLAIDIEN